MQPYVVGWRRWFLAVVFIWLFYALVPAWSPSHAAPGPLAFVDEEPQTFIVSDASSRMAVHLKNAGDETVTGLVFRLLMLQDSQGHDSFGQGVELESTALEIDPFALKSVELSLSEEDFAKLAERSSYTGLLVASAENAAPAQIAVALIRPPLSALTALTPEVTAKTLTITGGWVPFLIEDWLDRLGDMLSGTALPSSPDGVKQSSALESGRAGVLRLSGYDPNAHFLPALTPVVLSTEAGQSLKLRPIVTEDRGEVTVEFRAEGIQAPGTYTGTWTLSEGSNQQVELTAIVKDSWGFPLLVIVLGFGVAWWLTRYRTRVRPSKDVVRQGLLVLEDMDKDCQQMARDWDRVAVRNYRPVGHLRKLAERARVRLEAVKGHGARGDVSQLDSVLRRLEDAVERRLVRPTRQGDEAATDAVSCTDAIVADVENGKIGEAAEKLEDLVERLSRHQASHLAHTANEIRGLLVDNDGQQNDRTASPEQSEVLKQLRELKRRLQAIAAAFREDADAAARVRGLVRAALEAYNRRDWDEVAAELERIQHELGGGSVGTFVGLADRVEEQARSGAKLEDAEQTYQVMVDYANAYRALRASALSQQRLSEVKVDDLQQDPDYPEPVPDPRPQVEKQIQGLLDGRGRALSGAADAASLQAEISAARDLYAEFIRIYNRLQVAQLVCRHLEAAGRFPVGSEEDKLLRRIAATLRGVHHDLWTAASTADIAERRLRAKTEWSLGRLRELTRVVPSTEAILSEMQRYFSQLDVETPEEMDRWMERAVVREGGREPRTPSISADIEEARAKLDSFVGDLVSALRPEPVEPYAVDTTRTLADEYKEKAEALKVQVRGWDWGIAALGAVVAVVTALQALYVGEVFGTGWDYFGAFSWGVGVDAAGAGLAAILGKLGIDFLG